MHLDLGTKIRELRRRDNRTQEALAEALGVTSQAVSRWEAGGSYPDMNLIPAIANYFGITIDALFGYTNDREERIRGLVEKIQEMKWRNNGEDVDTDEMIGFARSALVEYPGNPQLMACLASVLYTAGYSRYGEHHLTDDDGYDIYDTKRHCGYAEWQEAVKLYEKALETLEESDFRRVAVGELMQLYVNMGMHDKANALTDAAPGIYSTREYMRICACDGKTRVRAYGKAILEMLHASAALMIHNVLSANRNMTPAEKAQEIQNAIGLFEHVCTDGNYGEHNRLIARMYTLLSVYLWLEGARDAAFDALQQALAHFRQFAELCRIEDPHYTAPMLRLVEVDFSRSVIPDPAQPDTTAASLYRAWPWWSVPEAEQVKMQMQADPRWEQWVRACDGT